MRIMASVAGQGALTLPKTAGLPKPVRGATDDLEPVVWSRRAIEDQLKRAEWLARNEGKRPAIEPSDQRGNACAGRLQVALHAEIHAPLGSQPAGIYNAGANLCELRARGLRDSSVIAAGPMAALTVDAFRKIAGKDRLAARKIMPGRNPRISVMAENAFVRNQAPGEWM